ncbi:3372_t:CDS:2 [Diversispora eburnea]|uniref:3372_t:CDS:1 n=1 Tax=Diversispora eburnea TaxID=1213867 RepID=A0A9N8WJR9_9GLOM|nr:3372_t:CDS:2 [Diversispora eburnea]
MATKAAYKRLTKEYVAIQKNPPPYLIAKPLESNILEWHYVIRGPPNTPYHNGEYHGTLMFPSEYPFKPPSIRMTTPSGRFQPDARLCLSMSDFHPSTWNPSWSVVTILTGLLTTTGSIKTTDADKKIYATRSHQFNMNDSKFRGLPNDPGAVNQQQVALRKMNLQRRPPDRVENCQRRRCDQWRKWIIVSLVCLYLVITKLLSRSAEAVSGSPGSEAPHM